MRNTKETRSLECHCLMPEFEGGEVKIFQKFQSLLTPYLYSSGCETDTPWKGGISCAIPNRNAQEGSKLWIPHGIWQIK